MSIQNVKVNRLTNNTPERRIPVKEMASVGLMVLLFEIVSVGFSYQYEFSSPCFLQLPDAAIYVVDVFLRLSYSVRLKKKKLVENKHMCILVIQNE